MANENAPHTNHSQFFITLGACEWLNKKHTIFGKVTGNTIFNVLRIGEVDTNEQDRPLEPITILQTEVLLNPFDDIIPRYIHHLISFFSSVTVTISTNAEIYPNSRKRKITLQRFLRHQQ